MEQALATSVASAFFAPSKLQRSPAAWRDSWCRRGMMRAGMMRAMKPALAVLITICMLAACSPEPVVQTPTGAQTFATHCASCHGPRAEGDGPVAATMNVTVPNLRTLSQRNHGQFPTDAVASYVDGRSLPTAHGTRAMPVWGGVFDTTGRLIEGAGNAKQRIDSVIEYLRGLQLTPN
jgi:mono/diheme cytochrome c family protein